MNLAQFRMRSLKARMRPHQIHRLQCSHSKRKHRPHRWRLHESFGPTQHTPCFTTHLHRVNNSSGDETHTHFLAVHESIYECPGELCRTLVALLLAKYLLLKNTHTSKPKKKTNQPISSDNIAHIHTTCIFIMIFIQISSHSMVG